MDYNKQTFDHVIRQSIKKFKTGDVAEETFKLISEDGREVKYTPEYFDELEKELLSNKEKEDKKESKKSKNKKKEPVEMSEGGSMGGDMMSGIAGIGDGYAKAYKDAAANTDSSKFKTSEPPRRR
jgi:hypothetical protein|tara:strand:- start:2254 stop:2628 length:375 start_codon:yes stop_codon:yes gene_type:complete